MEINFAKWNSIYNIFKFRKRIYRNIPFWWFFCLIYGLILCHYQMTNEKWFNGQNIWNFLTGFSITVHWPKFATLKYILFLYFLQCDSDSDGDKVRQNSFFSYFLFWHQDNLAFLRSVINSILEKAELLATMYAVIFQLSCQSLKVNQVKYVFIFWIDQNVLWGG